MHGLSGGIVLTDYIRSHLTPSHVMYMLDIEGVVY